MIRVEAAIMRRVALWGIACNFNAFISNQSIFNCLITGASTLPFFSNDNGNYNTILTNWLECQHSYKTLSR